MGYDKGTILLRQHKGVSSTIKTNVYLCGNAISMKHAILALSAILLVLSCTKEQPDTNKQDQASATEIEALRKEVKELRDKIEAITPTDPTQWVSASDFEALKQENEALKTQVQNLSSVFFEVDGLRFDLNGDVISTRKILATETTDYRNLYTLTTNRTYDAEGRLHETYSEFTNIKPTYTPPFFWQKELYEYNGKTVKVTTQAHKDYVAGSVVEEVTETTYW